MQRLQAVPPVSSGRRATLISTPAVPAASSGNRHHLAKVRVAGSNPVVRSKLRLLDEVCRAWRKEVGGRKEYARVERAVPVHRLYLRHAATASDDASDFEAGGA